MEGPRVSAGLVVFGWRPSSPAWLAGETGEWKLLHQEGLALPLRSPTASRSFCLGPAGGLTAKWQGLALGGAGRRAGVDRTEHGLSYHSA